MNKQAKRRPQQRKGRTAAAARGGKSNNRTTWILVSVVLVVGGVLLFAVASSSDKKTAGGIEGREAAPASLVSTVTGVSDDVINQVGEGDTVGLPIKVKTATDVLKTKDGKPRIVYMGAEYCPFCATERWGMVNALSRFGKFKDLKITTSGGLPEQFPNTATFSFYGSKYDSDYIQFEPIEQATNTGKALETPTSEQADIVAKYDVAPYTTRDGSIPFISFANQYFISGASWDAGKLAGLEHQQIADDMTNGSTGISQGAVGNANGMTAAICNLTDNKPADVCSQPAIKAIQQKL